MIGLLAALACPGPGWAQVIEFDPPEEITIDTSRLIVTFSDTVRSGDAEAAVAPLGVTVLTRVFEPVIVWGLTQDLPEVDALVAMREDARVLGLQVRPPSAAGGTWAVGKDGSPVMADFGTHAIRVTFPPWIDQDVAIAVVRGYLPEPPLRAEKYPNELTVALPEDGDEEAIVDALESNPLVQYVTYFSLDQPAIDE